LRTLAQHNDYVEDILRWEQAITQVTNSKGKLHCEQLLATLKDKIKNIDTVHSSSRGHAKLANINSLIKETVDLRRELNSLLKFD
jgi:hypothetical protein